MKSDFLRFNGDIIAWKIIRRIHREGNSVFVETDDGTIVFTLDSDEMAKDGILFIHSVLDVVD